MPNLWFLKQLPKTSQIQKLSLKKRSTELKISKLSNKFQIF